VPVLIDLLLRAGPVSTPELPFTQAYMHRVVGEAQLVLTQTEQDTADRLAQALLKSTDIGGQQTFEQPVHGSSLGSDDTAGRFSTLDHIIRSDQVCFGSIFAMHLVLCIALAFCLLIRAATLVADMSASL